MALWIKVAERLKETMKDLCGFSCVMNALGSKPVSFQTREFTLFGNCLPNSLFSSDRNTRQRLVPAEVESHHRSYHVRDKTETQLEGFGEERNAF